MPTARMLMLARVLMNMMLLPSMKARESFFRQPLPPPLPLGHLLLPIILMDISCLALPKHRKNLFSVYQIIEHDFFFVKKYLEVHLIRTNFELVTCGVLTLKEKINLQSTLKLTRQLWIKMTWSLTNVEMSPCRWGRWWGEEQPPSPQRDPPPSGQSLPTA